MINQITTMHDSLFCKEFSPLSTHSLVGVERLSDPRARQPVRIPSVVELVVEALMAGLHAVFDRFADTAQQFLVGNAFL